MSETPNTGAQPDVRFADFGLAPEIQRALDDQGYITPTPIQAQAIPVVLQGRDVMGAAFAQLTPVAVRLGYPEE